MRSWREILLVPMGKVDKGYFRGLATFLTRVSPLEVIPGDEIPLGEDPGEQIPGKVLLGRLPPGGEGRVVLGVTERDLGSRGRLYVFGQAALGHGLAVVSIHRLLHAHHGWSPSLDLLVERLGKVSLHEVGHAMGLPHCDGVCVMRLCTSVYQLDRMPLQFCGECLSKLGWQ